MAEGYPAEAAPTAADYQAALEGFFADTALDIQMRHVWLNWAEKASLINPSDVAAYRANMEQVADSNTTYAMEVMDELRQQGWSLWVAGPPGSIAQQLQGLQYNVGEPWYRAGIVLDGQPMLIPLGAPYTLEIRAPSPEAAFLPQGRTALSTALNERYDPSVHLNGPFRTPPPRSR